MNLVLGVKDTASVVGETVCALQSYIVTGHVPVVGGRGGKGNPQLLDARGIIAAGIVRYMRRQRIGLPAIRKLTDFLVDISLDDLLAAFKAGRVMLVSSDTLPPMLVRSDHAIVKRSGPQPEMLMAFNVGAYWERAVVAVTARVRALERVPASATEPVEAAEPAPAA